MNLVDSGHMHLEPTPGILHIFTYFRMDASTDDCDCAIINIATIRVRQYELRKQIQVRTMLR
jgi:hypothetical protein